MAELDAGTDIDSLVTKSLAGMPKADYGKAAQSLTDIGRQEEAATNRATQSYLGGVEKGKALAEKKYNDIENVDVKPWNVQEEKKKYETDPLATFGSFWNVAAVVASAFTRQPLVNSLTASAAFINAKADQNDLAYKQAYQAWKDNTDLAMKRHQLERESFDDALKLMQTNATAGKAQLAAVMARFGMQKKQAMMEAGMFPELMNAWTAEVKAYEGMAKASSEIQKNHLLNEAIKEENDYRKQNGKPPMTATEQLQFRSFAIPKTAKAALDEQDLKAINDNAENIFREAQASGHPISKNDAYLKARANFKIASSGSVLDDQTLDYMASQLNEGNTTVLSGLGWGAAASNARMEVRNRAVQMAIKSGLSPTEANAKIASFMGEKRGESALGQREAQITSAITTAQMTAQRVLDASEKVDRTEYPSFNRIILAAEQGTGGQDVIRFGIAANTLINNYARALGAGSSQLTDAARHEAQRMLETAWSKGQIRAAIDQMRLELNSELEGAKRAHGEFTSGYSKPKEQNLPEVVRQSGHIFKRQPDGSYKDVTGE